MWKFWAANFYDVAEHKLFILAIYHHQSVHNENLISMSTVNPEQSNATWVNAAYFMLSATAIEKEFFNHRHP